jgi:NleD-like pathogen effector protein (putative zinc metallopeptidase)
MMKIAGTPEYQKAVSDLLMTIKKNEVGKVIISGVENSKKELVIVPYNKGKAAVHGEDNAITNADDLKAGVPKGVSRKGPAYFYMGGADDPRTRDDERYGMAPLGVVGTGQGSDVHIFFSADAGANGISSCTSGLHGCQRDEVLLHEMVHGLRYMQGKSNVIPTDDSNYDNDEEFLAIVVTNVYLSAKGSLQLRADHHGYSALSAPLNTSTGFLSNTANRKLMNIYKLVWDPTFAQLSRVLTAPFNPFRQLTIDLAYLYRPTPVPYTAADLRAHHLGLRK